LNVGDLQNDFDPFFQKCHRIYPQSINTVKALPFIKNNRPDIFDVGFLKKDPTLINKLAKEYDIQKTSPNEYLYRINPVKEILIKITPLTFENIKQSCLIELQRYIASRGSMNDNGDFSPSLITRFFRKRLLTEQKVKATFDLIIKIKGSVSAKEIDNALLEIT